MRSALSYQVCYRVCMFIFVVYAWVRKCVNEVTKNDRLQFVLNISFVFILVIVIITFDLHFIFFCFYFFYLFIYFPFAFCFNNRYQFYINCKQFSVCPRQSNQRSLRTWPLCRFLYTNLIFVYIL